MSVKSVSAAAILADSYFTAINLGARGEDLVAAWDMLSTRLQCNPNDNCSFAHFRNRWCNRRVDSKIYNCGGNAVEAKLLYYARGTELPSLSRGSVHVRYQMAYEDGAPRLDSGEIIEAMSANCWATNPRP